MLANQAAFGRPNPLPYYHNLTDLEFEKLLNSIFNQHITVRQKPYCDLYDTVHLMPGVGDDGQDVILTKESRRVGLIQCKHYQAPLNKPECAKEIIKFALNAVCDPTLITDPDEFTYFLATTSKFAGTATTLLASFNTAISNESKLAEWTDQVIKKYKASFGHLTFQQVEPKLLDILTCIRVKTIIPTQLDEWLYDPNYIAIVRYFFPAFTFVVPVEQNHISLTNAQLIDEFFLASTDLSSWVTPFEQTGYLHLEREETSRILRWIDDPLAPVDDEQKIPNTAIFLVGGAGYGKTTILRDVLLRLRQQKIPVLGIKADRLVLNQRSDLERELNLSTKLDGAIQQLATFHSRVVVL